MAGPAWDVYVWVADDSDAVRDFLDRFVTDDSDAGLLAFRRVFLDRSATEADLDTLADLRVDTSRAGAVSLYLGAAEHEGAIVSATDQGEFTLGLSIDDPLGEPEVEERAAGLLASLRDRYRAGDGRAAVELAPARSRAEWDDDALVMLRTTTQAHPADEVAPGVVRCPVVSGPR